MPVKIMEILFSLAASIDSFPLDIFTDEPAQCKWDKRDIDYDLMSKEFSCSQSGLDFSLRGGYRCSADLPVEKPDTSISQTSSVINETGESGENTVRKENTYYFRCKDKAGNKNIQGSKFSLFSTLPLNIIKKDPSGLLRTGTGIELKIETVNGAENGIAICGWSQEDVLVANMPQFSSTNAAMHTQKLPPQPEGNYKFFIACIDKAGNLAGDSIEFTVERDTTAPQILFVTQDKQLGILTITTDEPANCEYAENDFSFGRGTAMGSTDKLEHQASLGMTRYVIKCRDLSEDQNEVTRKIVP